MDAPQCSDGTTAHHWKIAPAAGASSVGTCSKCGKSREFSNLHGVASGYGFNRQYAKMPRAKRQVEQDRLTEELRRLRNIDRMAS